jgi:hypothetical protein
MYFVARLLLIVAVLAGLSLGGADRGPRLARHRMDARLARLRQVSAHCSPSAKS